MKWLQSLFQRFASNNPRKSSYWAVRGYQYPNIMAVSYEWGLIDSQGHPKE